MKHLFSPQTTSKEARLLFMSPGGGSEVPQPQTQDEVEREVAERSQQEAQEQDPFANPAQAPERVRQTQQRTAERLSPALQRQLDMLEKQKRMYDEQITQLDRRLHDTGNSHRRNFRSGNAIHPRYGGGRGPAPYEYGLRMQVDAGMMRQMQRDLADLQMKRYEVQKSIDSIRAMEHAGLGVSTSSAPSTLQQNPNTFNSGPANAPMVNIEDRLKNMDPQVADLVRASPRRAQETIVHFLETIAPNEMAAAKTMLEKVNSSSATMGQLAELYAKTGSLESTSSLDPATRESLDSLTEQEKNLLMKLFDAAATLRTNSDSGQALEVDEKQVEKYVKRWKEAKTEADRMIAEGMLLLNGIDTDASDIEGEKLVTLPSDMRFGGIIAGIFKLALGIIEKFGGKSNKISATIDPKHHMIPESASAAERQEKIGELQTQIKGVQEQKNSLETRAASLKKQRETTTDPTEINEIDARIADVKAELKKIVAQLEELTKQVAAFVAAGRSQENADKK